MGPGSWFRSTVTGPRLGDVGRLDTSDSPPVGRLKTPVGRPRRSPRLAQAVAVLPWVEHRCVVRHRARSCVTEACSLGLRSFVFGSPAPTASRRSTGEASWEGGSPRTLALAHVCALQKERRPLQASFASALVCLLLHVGGFLTVVSVEARSRTPGLLSSQRLAVALAVVARGAALSVARRRSIMQLNFSIAVRNRLVSPCCVLPRRAAPPRNARRAPSDVRSCRRSVRRGSCAVACAIRVARSMPPTRGGRTRINCSAMSWWVPLAHPTQLTLASVADFKQG